MATLGFGFAETYVVRKMYKERMQKEAQKEKEEKKKSTDPKIHTITTGSQENASIGCFSCLSNHHRTKISRISDCNHT
ncbi:hypothetical protein VNO77_31454 [Canavalia gladiata]|uniref:Uncharacterized protein n=1 Tax=Canavalia gladiata TaxID=3824 RepID=A0AAN9KSN9_CANGL